VKTIPKQIYDVRDFINVLGDIPLKTQLVKERLKAADPIYDNIHVDWVKQVLKKLHSNGLVYGGLDANFGGYVWNLPAELKYSPEDFIQVLGKRPITTSAVIDKVNKPVKLHRKYKDLTEAVAEELLKNFLTEGSEVKGERDVVTKEWKWSIIQE
jgi:hypothetical protein